MLGSTSAATAYLPAVAMQRDGRHTPTSRRCRARGITTVSPLLGMQLPDHAYMMEYTASLCVVAWYLQNCVVDSSVLSLSHASYSTLAACADCGNLTFSWLWLLLLLPSCCGAKGFCGVRFNPYLWPQEGTGMKDATGLALYRKAGELGMPVGVMCFKGFGLHVEEIEALLQSSPQTKVCLVSFMYWLPAPAPVFTSSVQQCFA